MIHPLLAILAAALPAQAAPPADHNATPTLLVETAGIVPGQTAWLGVHFTIREGWHLYWDGFNASGEPPAATFHAPPGFKVADFLWPAPHRHVSTGDILDHVYDKEVLLLAPLTAPADAQPGSTITLKANLSWLVCSDVCIPESAHVALTIPVVDAGAAKPGPDAPTFKRFRDLLPAPLPPDVTITASASRATIEVNGAAALEFYPGKDSLPLLNPIRDAAAPGPRLTLPLGRPTDDRKHLKPRLTGVLMVKDPTKTRPAYYSVLKDVER